MRAGSVIVTAAALLAVAGGAVWFVASSRGRSERARAHAELRMDVARGGIRDLEWARARGMRLVASDRQDAEALGALAFVSATLAMDYAVDTSAEGDSLVARCRAVAARRTGAGSGGHLVLPPEAAAAAALWLARRGDRASAEAAARQASVDAPGSAFPLYALGRARLLGADVAGAARALEAAIVGNPAFLPARVAWAQAELDLGEAGAAGVALRAVLARAPDDARAQLLLEEADLDLDFGPGAAGSRAAGSPTPAGGPRPAICRDLDGPATRGAVSGTWPPAALFKAACALSEAVRARHAGARRRAAALATAAAAAVPDEPRLLARVAEELAQLGAVDRAALLLARARRVSSPDAPRLAWAEVAVKLGQGRSVSTTDLGRGLGSETGILEARAALATGGPSALVQVLDRLGDRAVAADPDLRELARLRTGSGALTTSEGDGIGIPHASPPEVAPAPIDDDDNPVRAYVDGLAARLAGDPAGAAERFWHALSGHGDACRAVGEYVASLRLLRLPADPSAWSALPADNAGCVNLRASR